MRKKAILLNDNQWTNLLLSNEVPLTNSQQNHFEKVLRNSNFAFTALSGKGHSVDGIVQNDCFRAKGGIKTIEKALKVSAFIGMVKRKAAEFITQKLTEIGVAEIFFFKADHSEQVLPDVDRLQTIAINACEQSFNPYLPVIYHVNREIDQLNIKPDIVYYGDFNSGKKLKATKSPEVGIIIGPEGGWSNRELMWLKNNFRGVSFSANVLRVETAAIVASGILLS